MEITISEVAALLMVVALVGFIIGMVVEVVKQMLR